MSARRDPVLAVVVPTRDRPAQVSALLRSLAGQSRRPDQVVLVDGGRRAPLDGPALAAAHPGLPLQVLTATRTGANAQRNQGLDALDAAVDWAVMLDDDIVALPDCLERLAVRAREAAPEIGGLGLNIVDEATPRLRAAKRLFGIDGPARGRVLPSAFNTLMCPLAPDEVLEVDWVHAGASAFRREVVERHRWEERFTGYAFADDVEYSCRVRLHHRLVAVGDCRVEHRHAPGRRAGGFALGVAQLRNRQLIVGRHPRRFSRAALCWASVGQVGINLARAVVDRDPYFWALAAGNAAAAVTPRWHPDERRG